MGTSATAPSPITPAADSCPGGVNDSFLVVFKALPAPGGPAAVLRLRRLLKLALRVCGLRAVRCVPAGDTSDMEAAAVEGVWGPVLQPNLRSRAGRPRTRPGRGSPKSPQKNPQTAHCTNCPGPTARMPVAYRPGTENMAMIGDDSRSLPDER
jgi:hypothetical protein